MKFTDLFIERPVLSIVVSLLILVLGARAVFQLPYCSGWFPSSSQRRFVR